MGTLHKDHTCAPNKPIYSFFNEGGVYFGLQVGDTVCCEGEDKAGNRGLKLLVITSTLRKQRRGGGASAEKGMRGRCDLGDTGEWLSGGLRSGSFAGRKVMGANQS